MHLEASNLDSDLDLHTGVIFCKQTLDSCKLETHLISDGLSAMVSRYNTVHVGGKQR